MAAALAPDSAGSETARLWRFGSAVFDEAGWVLTVAGERAPLENKPLRLLRELLLRPGEVVSKDALLDAVWPGVHVVEGSLTTAMNKLRRALADSEGQMIETVPGIGYRLAVPVRLEGPATIAAPVTPAPRWPRIAAGGAVLVAGALAFMTLRAPPPRPVTHLEVVTAMRALDLAAMKSLIARGWDPALPVGAERNSSIGTLLEICEWDPSHDRRRLVLAARLLIDAGAPVMTRNVWGDTPYSIARAPRYCGPGHPVTHLLKTGCTAADSRLDPRCLPDYAHSDWRQVSPPIPGYNRPG